jgi:2-polyprenyl-6-methoxyphenol hydroxylase-like FAD-dependent oxidoreductase
MQPQRDNTVDTDVLIVGGGPVGLALAIELGSQGHRCQLVESHPRSGLVPRAKTTNVRTRELLRRWGIADRLAAQSPFGTDYPSNVVFATRLGGREIARFENAFCCSPQRDERFAEHAQWIPQYKVEAVLRARVEELPGCTLRYGTRLHTLTQHAHGVQAEVEDLATGQRSQVRARYLVGADGARSTVREQLGIRMEGTSPLSHHRNVVFRAPGLAQAHALGAAVMYWIVNAEIPSVIAPLDQGDLWTFGYPKALQGQAPEEELIQRALGFAHPVEVLSTDDWTAHQLIAQRYRDGRVFLVGDACHLHPPFGGHGMNMGVGDAVDLGWKLSAVLARWAAPALLDSYETERRQVHQRVVDESVMNHSHSSGSLAHPLLEAEGDEADAVRTQVRDKVLSLKRPEFRSLSVVIGAHYETSPVLLRGPADQAPLLAQAEYAANARPGCRAPHLWLADGVGRGASLYDHLAAEGMSLLVTGAALAPDVAAQVADVAAAQGVPLRVLAPQDARLPGLYGAAYVLIRPDHHVAWRGDDLQELPLALQVARGARGERLGVATEVA